MNLYLILAIAFGAMTGAVAAPVARPVHLVSHRETRARRRVVAPRRSVAGRSGSASAFEAIATVERRPDIRSNTAPRAPALA